MNNNKNNISFNNKLLNKPKKSILKVRKDLDKIHQKRS